MDRNKASELRKRLELASDIERLESAFRIYRGAKGCEKAADRVGQQLMASRAMFARLVMEAG